MKSKLKRTFAITVNLFHPWTWKMAWRDSRRSRARLLFFSSSIILGVAALTAVGSLAHQMKNALEDQAKTLLGADLVIAARDPFSEAEEEWLRSLGGMQAREASFSTMVFFLKSERTRLVQVRAVEEGFPFYGSFETIPADAAATFRAMGSALVEQNVMAQFGVAVGDSIKIGELTLPVAGSLRKAPGETLAFATLAPRVYIPWTAIDKTKLIRPGSLARYRVYYRFDPDVNVVRLVREIRPQLDKFHFGSETVEDRKRGLGRAAENAYHFLNLIGFVALLLGGLSIASAIHAHVKQRLETVAILRCLGCSTSQAFAIYLAQCMAVGLIGTILGALLGIFIQLALPHVFVDFLPVKLQFSMSAISVVEGVLAGFLISVIFALLPLLAVRKVSPLNAIRAAYQQNSRSALRDPLTWLCYGLIGLFVLLFALTQTRRWTFGLGFAVAIGIAFGLLAGIAKVIVVLVRGRVLQAWPYVWRQGLANLHRPNNRTVLLMISLGFGTFLISTLSLIQRNLVGQLFSAERGHQGNAVLFDIQTDQKQPLIDWLRAEGFPLLEQAPIVTMRLASINGRSIDEIGKDRSIPKWALRREYRSTFRSELAETEKLIAGKWHERIADTNAPVPVSLEQDIAKRLRVTLGDVVVFDVQGIPVTTTVASLREVDWRRMAPNFFVVFPPGVLEDAPAFHVLVTRAESSERSAALHREVVKTFSNVSVIDLTLVQQTIDAVVNKISFVIRFMALFSIGTGLLLLAGAIVTGRYQRIQESTLLRALGASRRQVLQILAVEYLCLGFFGALTGIVLAVFASWALAIFVFKITFAVSIWPLLLSLAIASVLAVTIGLFSSRGICAHPPLEALRQET